MSHILRYEMFCNVIGNVFCALQTLNLYKGRKVCAIERVFLLDCDKNIPLMLL